MSYQTLTDQDKQEISDLVDSRVRKAQTKGIIGFVILAVGIGIAFYNSEKTADKTDRLAKQSAITRVKTVEQRCDLTEKILVASIDRSDDIATTTGLQDSLATCEKQLLEVKEIAKGA